MTTMSRRALLRRLLPATEPEPEPRYIVRVLRERCITFRGPECGACAGRCPGETQAIFMRRNRPVFMAESCHGCGQCLHACPAMPPALELEPHDPATAITSA